MSRYAIVHAGVVVNVVVSDTALEDNWHASETAEIGDIYQDGEFVRPAEPEADPAEALAAERARMVCSRFQAKAALLAAGLLDAVEAAVQDAGPLAQLAWREAVEFRRDSPTIAALADALGMTDEQLDDLFRAAAQISA